MTESIAICQCQSAPISKVVCACAAAGGTGSLSRVVGFVMIHRVRVVDELHFSIVVIRFVSVIQAECQQGRDANVSSISS
jgi:hypothetical protein